MTGRGGSPAVLDGSVLTRPVTTAVVPDVTRMQRDGPGLGQARLEPRLESPRLCENVLKVPPPAVSAGAGGGDCKARRGVRVAPREALNVTSSLEGG
eukprot:2398067-Pleurochrysis_carterae.AAC.4